MHRKFRITVDGHVYEVVVEEIVGEGGAAHWPTSVAAVSAVVASAPAASVPPASAPHAAAGDVVAPLAGAIQSVDVTVGQIVKAGDKVVTIEAMKMKTEVHAKADGAVVSIAVKPGDSVDTGAILLTLA